MIEFSALALLCGLGAKAFGNQADSLLLRLDDPSAKIAHVLCVVLGFLLLIGAAVLFVLALVTAPWESL